MPVVFDLDGVLADSRGPVVTCVSRALAELGYEPRTERQIEAIIGPPTEIGFGGLLNFPPDSPQAQRVGFDAHRGVKHVYVRVPGGAAARAPFPDGTVVVKAAGDDPLRPTLVAVMRKVAGADPASRSSMCRE